MKKSSITLVALLLFQSNYCQMILAPLTYEVAGITVYENVNYTGKSKFISIGNYPLTDFNNIISSIKVPPNYGVTIYESSHTKGGYGTSLDLMEDCADLSIYGLNDNVSYISVYSTIREGYVWVRGRKGPVEFMPGHWERARAGGGQNPDKSKPEVNGYSPNPSANEDRTVLRSLAVMPQHDYDLWNKAVQHQLGIIGSDYKGYEDIGSACFERAAEAFYIPNNLNFWFPQKQIQDPGTGLEYFKRTIVGKISSRNAPEVQDINEQYNDYDLNVHIKPNPNYMYLIDEAHKPEMSKKQFIKEVASNASYRHPWVTTISGCPDKFIGVEIEIDVKKEANDLLSRLASQRLELQMAAYGPWILDEGHCYQPEIHPAEQMWWKTELPNKNEYTCAVLCDASERFWWRDQMDDGTKIKPWGAPPITGTFAIAFEVPIGNSKTFEVAELAKLNVHSTINTNKTYQLLWQDKVLVSFLPHSDYFKVSFEKVGLKPGSTTMVIGFLVISSTVGVCKQTTDKLVIQAGVNTPSVTVNIPYGTDVNKIEEQYERKLFKKEGGYYVFKIQETTISKYPKINTGKSLQKTLNQF